MRKFSIAALAALLIAALFLGNCFTCPQLVLALGGHGCCHHSKPVKTECQSQGLKNFVKADPGAHGPTLAVASPVYTAAAAPLRPVTLEPVALEFSPPALHTTLRV